MPKFQAEAAHELGREQALTRLRDFLEKVEQEYAGQVSSLESEWIDDVLEFAMTAYGFTIKGAVTVDEEKASVHGNLPLAAAPFRGKIEKSISQALESALA